MEQFDGLCLGGVADGRRIVHDHRYLDVHAMPETFRTYNALEGDTIAASQVDVMTETYAWQNHYGLGFWIPVGGAVDDESVVDKLYAGYKRKPYIQPPKKDKRAKMRVKFRGK